MVEPLPQTMHGSRVWSSVLSRLLDARGVQIALQVRRVAELSEFRRAAPEEEPDGPVDHQASAPAATRHRDEVVGARREPRREALEPEAEHDGHGLVAAEVDEHAEGLVAELPHLAGAERRRDVVGGHLALAQRVL